MLDPSSTTSTLLNSLIVTISSHCETKDVKSLPSDVFIGLHSIFGNVFKAALDILDRGDLTKYVGEKSGREVAVVGGSKAGTRYTLLLDGQYCGCESYQFSVLRDHGSMYCKHLLALKLGLAMKKFREETVPDQRIQFLIEEMF